MEKEKEKEKEKGKHLLHAGCATVHTLKETVRSGRKDMHAQMEGKTSGDHGQGSGQWKQGIIINLVSDSIEISLL